MHLRPCGTLRGFMHRFDKLAKDLGQAALEASGVTVVNDPLTSETQYADLRHEPDPARQAARDRLGLLGRIAGRACLLEIYSDAPSAEEFRACVTKHLVHWQARARQVRRQTKTNPASVDPRDPVGDISDTGGTTAPSSPAIAPFLWVIAAGTPTTLIAELPLVPAADWPPGVYGFGGDVLRVGLVAARELSRDRTTLLIRLMAAGPLLAPAVPELFQLPPDAIERAVAEPHLLEYNRRLKQQPEPTTPDEQEFLVAMYQTWEDAKTQSRTEGSTAAHAQDVLTVLRARKIAVPDAVRQRILSERDPARLERWLERASVANAIAEVIDDAG